MKDKKMNISDFEKIELGTLTAASVFTVLGVYLFKNTVDANMIYLVTILVSAFVARKGLKYHYEYGQLKTDTTNGTDTTDGTDTTNQTT